MNGQGITQIVVYVVVLVALAYPLGLYMARVFDMSRRFGGSVLSGIENGFCRLVGTSAKREQDWRGYAKAVLVFSVVSSLLLYAIQRLQAHLFLNPDKVAAVPSHIALNTTASFVTNTNWQYYGGEYTMSYLTQMAGLRCSSTSPQRSASRCSSQSSAGWRDGRRRSSATSGSTSIARSSTCCCRCH